MIESFEPPSNNIQVTPGSERAEPILQAETEAQKDSEYIALASLSSGDTFTASLSEN